MASQLLLVVIAVAALGGVFVASQWGGAIGPIGPVCPTGYTWNGTFCDWSDDPRCPNDHHWDNSLGYCVVNTNPGPVCPINYIIQGNECVSLLVAKSMTIFASTNSATAGSPKAITITYLNVQNNALTNYQANVAPVVNSQSSNQYISATSGGNGQATVQHTFSSAGTYMLQFKTNTGIISNVLTITVTGGTVNCEQGWHKENGVCVPDDNNNGDRLTNMALFRPQRSNSGVNQETFNIYSIPGVLTPVDFIGTYYPSDNWSYVKSLSTQSGAQIYIGYPACSTTCGNIKSSYPGTTWIMHDVELPIAAGAATNAALQTGYDKVKAAGLKYLPNLGANSNNDESNVRKAASLADGAIVIQVMGQQVGTQAAFQNFVMKTVGWINSERPGLDIYIGPSVSYRDQNNQYREPTYVYSLINALPDGAIDGVHVFYGYASDTTTETRLADLPRLREMMNLLY